MKKKVVFFSIADNNNKKYFDRLEKSFHHFHPDIELRLWDQHKIESYNDPHFMYRATPTIARQLLKDHDLVVKIDADSIVTGNLDHIIKADDYDAAAPLNWNRVDPALYGVVTVLNINPTAYFNCGLVAMRSRELVEKWFRLCNSSHFGAYKYREQDLLNIIAYYFDWRFKNLDAETTWNGLISKGEMGRFVLKESTKLVCPVNKDGFPNQEMTIKVIHLAGGNNPNDKMHYIFTHCSEDVSNYIKGLTNG